jgi:hypothetical protein
MENAGPNLKELEVGGVGFEGTDGLNTLPFCWVRDSDLQVGLRYMQQ